MKIPSKDVIQADSPERVMSVVAAVAGGTRTDRDIAQAIGNLDPRQGRYYRRAAEILGFIKRTKGNYSVLTTKGRRYSRGNQREKRNLFVQTFLTNPLVSRMLPFIESHEKGSSRSELEEFLGSVADLGTTSMIHRRVSSYISWLQYLGIIKFLNNELVLQQLPASIPFINITSDEEPILPQRYELKEYEEQSRRVRNSSLVLSYLVTQASRERALTSHAGLVRMVAERLRLYGAIPRSNRYIDLSVRTGGFDYLFEMKSTTKQNLHDQIRRGLSQLYEYKYIQGLKEPRLVLVVENPLPRPYQWFVDYLLEDRKILLIWDGSGTLHCPNKVATQLPFL